MVTRDSAIRYKNLYKEIEITLTNIEKIGFDTTEYKKALNDINTSITRNIKNVSGEGYAKRAAYTTDYDAGIGKLTSLKNYLDRYNCYFIAFNASKWLEMKLKEDNISQEQLEGYVSEMIRIIKGIVNSDTMDYDDEKHIVDSVYKVAYELIKMEIILAGESQLFLYIKNEEANIAYFDELIGKDIAKVDLNVEKNYRLKEIMYDKYRKGINSTLFDIDIIRQLLINDNKLQLKKTIINNITATNNEIEQNLRKIADLESTIENIESRTIQRNKQNMRESRKEVIRGLVSMGLALSIMIGGGIGIAKGSKKLATENAYTKREEIYSSIDGETTEKETKVFVTSKEGPQDNIKLRAYGPYQDEKERSYQEYDVTFKDFDSLEDYYNYGIDEYGVVPTEVTLKSKNGDVISNYQDSYTEVIKSTYESLGKELNKSDYIFMLIVFYILYTIVLAAMEFLYFSVTDYESVIIGTMSEILAYLPDYITEFRNNKSYNKELAEKVNQLYELVNKNDELRSRFNELYESNKYLLDDETELLNRINEIKNDPKLAKAKNIVKTKKKEIK